MKHFRIIGLAILAICCTAPPTSMSEQDRIVVRESVRKVLQDYYNDIREKGLMAEFSYLDSSDDFFWVPPGYGNAISYDSVSKVIRKNAANYTQVDNSFDDLLILPLRDDLATYSALIRSKMTETSGTVTTFKLVESGVMIKRSDGWKLLSGQTSIVPE